MTHSWIKSTLGHGETMCQWCHTTNREAAALGILDKPCDRAPTPKGLHSSQATVDVLEERYRQIHEEGWTGAHDDKHDLYVLGRAAACYLLMSVASVDDFVRRIWPFDLAWWKPKDYRRNLVRAAALIIAELDRYDRKEGRRGP
jgi:hypothetical protein